MFLSFVDFNYLTKKRNIEDRLPLFG